MTCGYSERGLSLYAEGDLPEAEALEIEQHLSECAGCRTFMTELRESQSVLKAIRQDTFGLTAQISVRAKVLEQVNAGGPSPGWSLRVEKWLFGYRRRLVIGALAMVLVGLGTMWLVRGRPDAPQQEVTSVVPDPAIVPPPVAAQPPPVVERKPVKVRRPRVVPVVAEELPPSEAAPVSPVVVKVFTDDPNVIIYWLLDGNGGGE